MPGLARLDESLRCHVCKDFYNAPVITTCGHTFCSLCIRRHLDMNTRCPICWQETTISQLRANITVADATEAFVRVSEQLKSQAAQTQQDKPETVEPAPKLKACDEQGECPICSSVMPLKQLQTTHIDNCLRRQDRKPSATFSKKIPMPNYMLLSETKLRKMLLDAGLSTKGNKQRLQARFKEYVHQFNANVDSQRPMTRSQLLQVMHNWDTVQQKVSMGSIKDIDASKWSAQYQEDFAELTVQAQKGKSARQHNN